MSLVPQCPHCITDVTCLMVLDYYSDTNLVVVGVVWLIFGYLMGVCDGPGWVFYYIRSFIYIFNL